MLIFATIAISILCLIPIATFAGLLRDWRAMPPDQRKDERYPKVLKMIHNKINLYLWIWITSLVLLTLAYFTR